MKTDENMCWSSNSKTLSWLGIMWGLLSLATLLTAFLSNVWLYTKEPIRFPNSDILTTVTFKIGLWRICPSFKRTNATPYIPNPSCNSIKYSSWDDITASDLGISTSLEFTPSFLSKMRISTIFGAVSLIFIFLAIAFALLGFYNSDHKTIVACGLFILGGLTLGGGLLIFASVLSDAYFERPKRSHVIGDGFDKVTSSSSFDYKYGWSFFAAGAAFFMAELAAVLSISAYVRRFPTVEEMVRVMVPGAERRLKERHGLAGEYLVQHKNKRLESDASASLTTGLTSKCKSEALTGKDFQRVEGSLFLNKPAPDICASNPAAIAENIMTFSNPPSSSEVLAAPAGAYCPGSETSYILDEIGSAGADTILSNSPLRNPLAGQTVPIVLMHHSQRNSGSPFMLSVPNSECQRNFKMAVVENAGNFEPTQFTSGHLPFSDCEMSGLNQNFYSNQYNEFKEHLIEGENFNFGLKHLNNGPGEDCFFGTFHGDKTFTQTGMLDQCSDLPGTFSTTSSSSGTGSGTTVTTGSSQSGLSKKRVNFGTQEKKKKKSVTIGSVFSKMETFEPDRTDCVTFECRSGV